jgi:hypothetical protein
MCSANLTKTNTVFRQYPNFCYSFPPETCRWMWLKMFSLYVLVYRHQIPPVLKTNAKKFILDLEHRSFSFWWFVSTTLSVCIALWFDIWFEIIFAGETFSLYNRRRCERCDQKTSWRHFSSVDVAPRKNRIHFSAWFIQKKTLSTCILFSIFFVRKTDEMLRTLRLMHDGIRCHKTLPKQVGYGKGPYGARTPKLIDWSFWDRN